MKGKQLSLEEVLNLEDGTKVWVESKEFGNKGEVLSLLFDRYGYDFILKDCREEFYSDCVFDSLQVFEWTEREIKKLNTFDCNEPIVISMAQEICNLRGLDLTDKNIEKIVEEFKEESNGV